MARLRRWRRWRWTMAVAAVAYLLIMTFGGCADRLILFPSKHPVDAGRAVRHTIDLNGKKIEVWSASSPSVGGHEPRGYVLEFCGNATRAEQIAQYVADRWKDYAVEAWVMNYPGYGGSEGGAHLALIAPAALATYDQLVRAAKDRPIFLEANSLGTAPAMYVAANRPVAGLVLQNPPPLQKLILGQYGWWNLWLIAGPISWQVPRELNSLTNAPKLNMPAVFLSADHDSVVPMKYQQMIIDAYRGPKRVIVMKAASHWQSVEGDANAQLLAGIDWLWNGGKP